MTFDALYQAYQPRVYRLCRGYVGDAAWAQDLVQEIFVSVWRALPGFRHEAAVSTWIFRIATNTCLRQLQRAKKHATVDLPDHLSETLAAEAPAEDERVALLYRAIGSLSETDRILISLLLEDLPYPDIATVLGISEGNVRVRIHRAKEKLTAQLATYGLAR
jgi:RNA polymerase sigma-70 factor, ECF subfamily